MNRQITQKERPRNRRKDRKTEGDTYKQKKRLKNRRRDRETEEETDNTEGEIEKQKGRQTNGKADIKRKTNRYKEEQAVK